MKLAFEEALIELSRQALVGKGKTVELDAKRFRVRRTAKRGLRTLIHYHLRELRQIEWNYQGSGKTGKV